MVDHSSKDGDPGVKASPGSEIGARKFTQSCSRCRASKLKCDKNEPCVFLVFLSNVDFVPNIFHVDGMRQT